jgi:hypothetical protein
MKDCEAYFIHAHSLCHTCTEVKNSRFHPVLLWHVGTGELLSWCCINWPDMLENVRTYWSKNLSISKQTNGEIVCTLHALLQMHAVIFHYTKICFVMIQSILGSLGFITLISFVVKNIFTVLYFNQATCCKIHCTTTIYLVNTKL